MNEPHDPLLPIDDIPDEVLPEDRWNWWAVVSLVAGIIAFIFGFTFLTVPFPTVSFTTCPGGIVALLAGWVGLRAARKHGQRRAAAQAWWGMGLGCGGYAVMALEALVVLGVLIAVLVFGVDILAGVVPEAWLQALPGAGG